MAALEQTLPAIGDGAWTRAGTAESLAARPVAGGHAPSPAAPRRRVLEAVPPFAFLPMPAQDLR